MEQRMPLLEVDPQAVEARLWQKDNESIRKTEQTEYLSSMHMRYKYKSVSADKVERQEADEPERSHKFRRQSPSQ